MSAAAPPGGDQNRGPALVAIYWTESAFATIAVLLRLYGRRLIRNFGADDYVMVFALALFLTLAAFVTYLASIGGCRHLYYLSTAQQLQAVKYNWITQTWGIAGFAVGKSSVALQIIRILGPNDHWIKWTCWVLIGSTSLFCGLDCLFGFVQCNPPRALWDPSVAQNCWDTSVQADFAIFISAWNVMADLILAALPIPIIWRTSLTLKQRIATCTLLGLGPVAAACGLVKIQFLAGLTDRSDLTWQTYNLYVWSGSELFVIIICGCIPPMRPIFTHFFGREKTLFTGYYDSNFSGRRKNKHNILGSTDLDQSQNQDDDTEALRSDIQQGLPTNRSSNDDAIYLETRTPVGVERNL
ncbi:integral membrane protein [Penicillium angulare]|uniref:uncharacterized protein n=1 Tax=Penicillium angulare TaxID=116970 RepID=UPI002540F16D|nr:uncharacterized protein N7478_006895 [Penicillium angulare]KAJ5281523.1 integral membrane protein [Penicillium angulare]